MNAQTYLYNTISIFADRLFCRTFYRWALVGAPDLFVPSGCRTLSVWLYTRARQLPEGSVYLADVGQNQIWSARNYTANGRFLTTGGMGTMGYSIPAAIGAKLACPEKTVAVVCGDGAFQMSLNELATANQHGAPIKLVVLNNGILGMIRELQQRAGSGEFAVELTGGPHLELIAQAYGIQYARLEAMAEMERAIQDMLDAGGSYLLECIVSPEEVTS